MAKLDELQAAMRYLAGSCDGAVMQDGQGFNRLDSNFGHSLAGQKHWSERQAGLSQKLLKKYKRQLIAAGFDMEDLFSGTVETDSENLYKPEQVLSSVEPILKDGQIDGISLKCPFDSNDRAKSVPSCRFWKEKKRWRYKPEISILEKIEEVFPEAQIDDRLVRWKQDYREHTNNLLQAKRLQDAELPLEGAEKLYPYQRTGINFLTKAGRTLLTDDMGLGKSVQALLSAELLKTKRILIICPNSLKDNWSTEIGKWVPHRKDTVLGGARKKKEKLIEKYSEEEDYLIINYEAARWSYTEKTVAGKKKRVRSNKHEIIDDLLKINWDLVIVDEAHNVKNRKAAQTEGVKALVVKTPNAFLLTGTPLMNKVDELWSPLNMLYPKTYTSFWDFVKEHANAYPDRYGWVIEPAPTNPEKLKAEIAPFFLRREKEEVFPEMPERIYQKMWVDMEDEQQRIYEEIEEQAMTEIDDDLTVITPGVLAQLTRCKQVAVSPGLIGGEPTGAKLTALLDVLNGTDKKVLVFSQFAEAIKLASSHLSEAEIEHVTFTGKTPEAKRHEAIKKFQEDPNTRVLMSTMQVGGVGLNMTAASIVVFLDKHWTPATNEQAIARTRPHLQKQSIQVIDLLARGTVDQMIEDMLSGKTTIIESIMKKKEGLKK